MRGLTCFAVLLLAVGALPAQHGRAPRAGAPAGYLGDTWTGQLKTADDATNKITLIYQGGKASESFTGVLPHGHDVKLDDGSVAEFKPSMIKLGARMRVYYVAKVHAVNGHQERTNEIFKFDFLAPYGN